MGIADRAKRLEFRLEFDALLNQTLAAADSIQLVPESGGTPASTLLLFDGRVLRVTPPDRMAGGKYRLRLKPNTIFDPRGLPIAIADIVFTVDDTPPQLLPRPSSAPPIAASGPLELTFDEDLSASSIGALSIPFTEVGPGRLEQVNARTIRFYPTWPMRGDTDYTLSLYATDLYDNGVLVSSSFRTAPAAFGESPTPAQLLLSDVVAGGDVTGDGREDIVTIGAGTSALWIYPQRSDGSLGERIEIAFPSTSSSCTRRALVVVDLNGDGRKDVVASGSGNLNCGIDIFQQDVNGNLRATHFLVTNNGLRLRAVDLNGDGRLDLVSAGSPGSDPSGSISYWLQDATGSWSSERILNLPPTFVNDLAVGDLNNDGKPDLAIASSSSAQVPGVQVLYQTAGMAFSAPRVVQVDSSRGADALSIFDVTGDGLPDLMAGSSMGPLLVWAQTAGGDLSSPTAFDGIRGPRQIIWRDVDGDGLVDLLVRQQGLVAMVVYRQQAAGSFRRVQQMDNELPPNADPYGTALLDVNGDGRVDLIFGRRVLLNNGPAAFLR